MTAPETVTKKHPVRGAIYGLCLGIGVAVYLVLLYITPFSVTTMVIVVVVCIILGILWGLFAPPKKPKGPPPVRMEHEPSDAMASAGFDAVAGETEAAGDADQSGLAPPPEVPDADSET